MIGTEQHTAATAPLPHHALVTEHTVDSSMGRVSAASNASCIHPALSEQWITAGSSNALRATSIAEQ